MAQNNIPPNETYSHILVAGEANHPTYLFVKDAMGTSPVPNNYTSSPHGMSPSFFSPPMYLEMSLEAPMDSSSFVIPNNIISAKMNSAADSTMTHISGDGTKNDFTYYQSNFTPASNLSLHFHRPLQPDVVADTSDAFINRYDLSSSSTKHQDRPIICRSSWTKSDHRIGMDSNCERFKGSVDSKVRMQQDRLLCEKFLDSLSRLEDWLQATQIAASLQDPSQALQKETKQALAKYEVLLRDIRGKLLDLESLNRQYWRITQIPQQMFLPTSLRGRMQEVNHFWDHLEKEAKTIYQALKSKVQQKEEFDADQDDVKLCLTEMDMELSSVEYIYNGNSTEKIQQLKAFQEDVWNNMKRVECLLERGDQLMYESDPQDAVVLEDEMTELGSYCQEIFIRLSRLQKRLVSTKLVFEDDVLDSGFEHVSSGSSDVFLELDLEDEEVPTLPSLSPANAALAIDLEWDPMGDVGSSGSHDDISRYTPRKRSRRNKFSESSVSTDSGVTNSKHRSHEDLSPVEEDLRALILPGGAAISQGFGRPKINIQVQTVDSEVLCHDDILPYLETKRLKFPSSCGSLPGDTLDSGHRIENPLQEPKYDGTLSERGAPMAADAQVTERLHYNIPGQRRRQGRKKKMHQTQNVKPKHQPARQEVTILMDSGDDTTNMKPYKSSYGCSRSPWRLFKGLTFLSIVFLLLCGSLLMFPLSQGRCPSQRFSWTLMLTYVNGPPPI